MREKTVEQELVRRVKAIGGDVRKLRWVGIRGAPDRLVMLPETPAGEMATGAPAERFLVELKAPGGRLAPHQQREHKRLRKFGWRVEVIDNQEDITRALR